MQSILTYALEVKLLERISFISRGGKECANGCRKYNALCERKAVE